uniref:ATP-dependent Clp protease proteolytic subunit n=1 Tax=Corydalis mucronifera TaxID=2878456 RepID=A0A8K1ZST3_9MAGN|nr:clp protease proteolytic subunit [Corydalis mucronifera]
MLNPMHQKHACRVSLRDKNFFLINRLHQERLLFLLRKLDHELALNLQGLLVALSREDETWNMFMFIHCKGGWASDGLGLGEMMRWVTPCVATAALGEVYSTATMVLCGGTPGDRVAYPHVLGRANAF